MNVEKDSDKWILENIWPISLVPTSYQTAAEAPMGLEGHYVGVKNLS